MNDKLYKVFLQSTGVTTDTRKIREGNIYFALSGENFDGNAFAGDALKKGCSFAVVDKAEYVKSSQYILVEDSLKALQDLASCHRDRLSIPFIGITGTNGKTTTKELIAKVLSSQYKVLYTEGNLNNHIGVPLTLLKVSNETEIAIIEMGANHPGEIEFLCNIANPTHGIITNIGRAHLEGFGGFEGVKKTKNELYSHLVKNGGVIFSNSDNPILSSLLQGRDVTKVFYGNSKDALCSGEIIKSDPYLEFSVAGEEKIKTKLAGRYNLENALAAVCFGLYFKVPFDKVRSALESYEPSNQRSQIKQSGSNVLLMDYYNANPSSMEVALDNFSKMDHAKKIVVLGDMLELGDESTAEHEKIAKHLLSMNLEKIILVGPIFHSLPASEKWEVFLNSQEARSWVEKNKPEGSLILIKGSRGVKLESIVEVL
jgi:UDP-N-acetylmuramoyl-tripeptide--D-alanyl-D-alanine ligase